MTAPRQAAFPTLADWPQANRILRAHGRGSIPPAMAAMELLIACADVPVALAALAEAIERASAARRPRLLALRALITRNRAGCERIAGMVRAEVDHSRPLPSIAAGLEHCRRLFDWSVQQNPEASVALYSLTNPRLLARATREVVGWMKAQGLLGPARDTLEIGCGIGRMQAALAPLVRTAHGIDLSGNMVAEARARCAGLANVRITRTAGRDLSRFGDASLDLVYAVDSFPYLVQSGIALVETHVHEAARVLRPGGDLLILNFSYRADAAVDRATVRSIAADADLRVRLCGKKPFIHWDAEAFWLRKPARSVARLRRRQSDRRDGRDARRDRR